MLHVDKKISFIKNKEISNPEKNKYFKNVTLETSQTSTFFMKLEKDHILWNHFKHENFFLANQGLYNIDSLFM